MSLGKKFLAGALTVVVGLGAAAPRLMPSADPTVNFSAIAGSKFVASYKDKSDGDQPTTKEMTAYSYSEGGKTGYAYSVEDVPQSTNLTGSVLGSNLDQGSLHRMLAFAKSFSYTKLNETIGSSLMNESELQGAIQLAVHKLTKERSSKLSYVSTDSAYARLDYAADYLVKNFPSDHSLVAPTTLTTKVDKIMTLNTSDTTYDYYGPFLFESNRDITPQFTFTGNPKGMTVVNAKFEPVNSMVKGRNYFLRVTKNQQLPTTSLILSWVGVDSKFKVYGTNPGQLVTVVDAPVTLTETINISKPQGGGTIKITNTLGDEFGTAQNGGTFQVKNEDGKTVQTLKVESNGTVYTNLLPLGIYTVTNTDAAPGIKLVTSPKQVSIRQDGQVQEVKFVSEASVGRLQIVNTDSNGIRLNGGQFKVFNSKDNSLVKEVGIVENGTAHVELADGTYYLTQTVAPIGVTRNENRFYFIVAASQQQPSVTVVNTATATANNSVKIIVTDYVTGAAVGGGTYNILDVNDRIVDTVMINTSGFGTSRSLTSGTYKIKQASAAEGYNVTQDVYSVVLGTGGVSEVKITNTPIGSSVDKTGITISCYAGSTPLEAVFAVMQNGKEVTRVLTDKTGVGYSISLPYGNYTVKQLSTQNGYQVNSREFQVTLNSSNKMQRLQVENYVGTATQDGSYNISVKRDNGNSMNGVTVLIKTTSGALVVQTTTNNSGTVVGTLPVGSYNASVQIVANGTTYTSDPTLFSVVKDSTAFVEFKWDGSRITTEYVTKRASLGYLEVTVLDDDGRAVSGAEVRVVGDTTETRKTNNKGLSTFNLEADSYKVSVISVDGRTISSENKTVTVANSETSRVEFQWDGTRANVSGSSRNNSSKSEDNEITVTVYGDNDTTLRNSKVVLYKNGREYETGTTSSNGEVRFRNLPNGNYSVKQTTANGTSISSNEVEVNLYNGSAVTVNFYTDEQNRRSTGRVGRTSSREETGDKSISGYIFKDVNDNGVYDLNDELMTNQDVYLYSEDGALLKTYNITSDSKYVFSNLASKKYEVRFQLPSGYRFAVKTNQGSDNTRSSVDENGRVQVDLYTENGRYVNCGFVQTSEVIQDPNQININNTSVGTNDVIDIGSDNNNNEDTVVIGDTVNTADTVDIGSAEDVNLTGYVDSSNPDKGGWANPEQVPVTGYNNTLKVLGGVLGLLLGVAVLLRREGKEH